MEKLKLLTSEKILFIESIFHLVVPRYLVWVRGGGGEGGGGMGGDRQKVTKCVPLRENGENYGFASIQLNM